MYNYDNLNEQTHTTVLELR